jgi:hypothetical protein
MRTRNGIYYDLTKSSYKYRIPDLPVTLVFSSDLHKLKFIENYQQNRQEQNLKFKARYRLECDLKLLHDMALYRKIETRGFLVINEGGQKLCQENLILNGERVMPRS